MANRGSMILVVGSVKDMPNRNSYQRVLALADAYPLYVITMSPLPMALRDKVREVHVVGRWLLMWWTCLKLARCLGGEGEVVVHTVYAPISMVAGFICRAVVPCCWVYDLYDHPSLTWSSSGRLGRPLKWTVWHFALSHMARLADVWVIGMHPGILSHLPVPKRDCRLVLSGGPGIQDQSVVEGGSGRSSELSICYAGALSMKRGADLIATWARSYEGAPASLHLMGREDDVAVAAIEAVRGEAERRGLRIVRHGWIDHTKVIEIVQSGDIGLCPIDPAVLNYRYAYPVKVVEYMSHGVVPVATDGQGVRALIRHGENGFVARYDAESFSRAITQALSACQDADCREKLVANMRKSVEGRDWKTINHRLLADIEIALAVTT